MKRITLALTVALSLGTSGLFAADAAENWTALCAKCHGADGAGKTKAGQKLKLKDYTDAKVQGEMTDEAMAKAIKEGVTENGKERMKAFSDLSDADVAALVAHIRSMKK